MTTKHADSQVEPAEAIRLMQSALGSREHRASRRLVQGCAISTGEFLGHWSMTTPEGPLHTVSLARMVDGEEYQTWNYTSESDAVAVWEHAKAEAQESGTAK